MSSFPSASASGFSLESTLIFASSSILLSLIFKLKTFPFLSRKNISLKLICVNDVYELDNLPYFASAIKIEAAKDSENLKTISLLPGDFLAPSLLSSLDKGIGMVDCLNHCNLDFCCIGNHENDVGIRQLQERIKQSKFTWVNSNMQSLPLLPDQRPLPEYSIVEVGSGEDKKRIAIIGLNTEDPTILMPGKKQS